MLLVGISNPVFGHPAEAVCSDPASSLKAGGQNWPVSDWKMSHSSLGGWGVFGGEPEGPDATTRNISCCLLLIVLMLQMLPVPFCLA